MLYFILILLVPAILYTTYILFSFPQIDGVIKSVPCLGGISSSVYEVSSGVYIYRITALSGERILFSQSKRMMLIK